MDDRADEVPILNIDDLLYHLETAIERRNAKSLAEKDPKLKCKIHFLINVRLYKIINRDLTRLAEMSLLETAGLEYYTSSVATIKNKEK